MLSPKAWDRARSMVWVSAYRRTRRAFSSVPIGGPFNLPVNRPPGKPGSLVDSTREGAITSAAPSSFASGSMMKSMEPVTSTMIRPPSRCSARQASTSWNCRGLITASWHDATRPLVSATDMPA